MLVEFAASKKFPEWSINMYKKSEVQKVWKEMYKSSQWTSNGLEIVTGKGDVITITKSVSSPQKLYHS